MDEKARIEESVSALAGIADPADLRVLGTGSESVVFTDGRMVFKTFHDPDGMYVRLGEQIGGRFVDCRHIPDPDTIRNGDWTILTYEYSESDPYQGGLEDQMAEFLVEAATSGVCIRDVKPLNLRVASGTLVFIDFGWDIVPFCIRDFLYMAQRGFLCVHYGNGDGFRDMARRAIREWDMPELEGFPAFFNRIYNEFRRVQGIKGKAAPFHVGEHGWVAATLSECPGAHSLVAVDRTPTMDELLHLRSGMSEGDECVVIRRNPFFHSDEPVSIEDMMNRSGLALLSSSDSPPHPDGEMYASELTAERCIAFEPLEEPVSLLIKTCYQDAEVLDGCIRHIVKQLDHPDRFDEIVVVVDCKSNGFLREYSEGNETLTVSVLRDLVSEDVIDRYEIVRNDPDSFRRVNSEWFGIDSRASHSIRNIPVASQLLGFEHCRNRYILQCDCDVIIVRRDGGHRYLKDMMDALKGDGDAVSVGFNIAHEPGSGFNVYGHPGDGGFVPEVRICLLDRDRLESLRPLENSVVDGRPELSWYRSVERTQRTLGKHSLRGGDPRTFYIHPQNSMKNDRVFWRTVLDCAESGWVPEEQFGHVDLIEDRRAWDRRVRGAFVFIICGRNPTNGMFLRCWQSVLSQTRDDWSAVIVDDASDNGASEYIRHATLPYSDRVVLTRNTRRVGMLCNIVSSMEHSNDGNQVIVTLDMDDMLISKDYLEKLRTMYLRGHDLVIGTTLKSTKGILPFVPDFRNPRNSRMGDVWMHPRSFRRYLFDAIPREEFMDPAGSWVDHFTELTFMVPMVEMAESPGFIDWPVYYWEPRITRDDSHYEKVDRTKELVRSRRPHSPDDVVKGFPLPAGSYSGMIVPGTVTFVRHGEKTGSTADADLTDRGRREAETLGSSIPEPVGLFLVSPTPRTRSTAEHIALGNHSDAPIVELPTLRGPGIIDRERWREMKREYGYDGAMNRWVSGDLPPGIMRPFDEDVYAMISSVLEASIDTDGPVVAVTHDHVLRTMARVLGRNAGGKIRYMDGIVVDRETLYGIALSRHIRLQDLGTAYETSRDSIEIDITYRCDLKCLNCDRSCNHPCDTDDMDVSVIEDFIRRSESSGRTWKRIAVLGGEPTLHPGLRRIMELLSEYSGRNPGTEIVLHTNGLGAIPELPSGVVVHNTHKTGIVNQRFDPYHMSPSDLGLDTDYSRGCWITRDCGMGLNINGYYACAAGAALDRVFGFHVGFDTFDLDEEDFRRQKAVLCRHCGHFCFRNYPDHEKVLRMGAMEPMTVSWKKALEGRR